MMPASYGSFSLHEEDGRWRANASEVQHTLAAVFALSRAPVPDTHRGAVTKAAIETCVEEIRMLSSARYLLTLEQWDQALLAILAEVRLLSTIQYRADERNAGVAQEHGTWTRPLPRAQGR